MNFTRSVVLALKGCAMGMADVVPGVSGGTIAFISGIYEELIDSIRSVDAMALRLLVRLRLGELWRHINGSFLLPVLLGIAVAIFSLARLMTYLLQHHPIEIWSFFFGLIIASALLVARQVGRWDWRSVLSFAVGAAAAWWITVATPTETPNDWWFVMLSGAIAICAMILPGISGAFILLLLGKYQYIMQAVGDLNIPVIVIFVVGAAAGIISFSHLLSWLLKRWHDVTVAVLMAIFCNELIVADDGEITGFKMRCPQSKLTTVKALQSIGYDTIASGDSHNDLGMIYASKAGFLFKSTDQIKADNPDLEAFETYDELLAAIKKAMD